MIQLQTAGWGGIKAWQLWAKRLGVKRATALVRKNVGLKATEPLVKSAYRGRSRRWLRRSNRKWVKWAR